MFHLLFWNRDFKVRMQVETFSVESSFASIKISLETLKREIKPLDTEIYEFDYRDNWKLLELLGNIEPTRCWSKDQRWQLFRGIVRHKLKFFDWGVVWRKQARLHGDEKMHFLQYRCIRIISQKTNPKTVQWNTFVRIDGLDLRPEGKNSYWERKVNCNVHGFQQCLCFSDILFLWWSWNDKFR